MYAVEFESNIKNGIIHVPDEYKSFYNNVYAKCFLVIDETKQKPEIKRKMSAISIDTKTYKFDRDEANER
ncbi:MAG: hypothetical protein L0Y61_01925 [Epsilonproteobacteria bacterium]|nr:hypothetical protein [Campylobacterota bacterium]